MIPYILAAVGGYLIGQSRKETYADGGMMADGGMTERYFIYKEQEKYLNQLKEGKIHSDDLETLLNNLFTDVHKVNRVNQSDFKEITKSEKDLIVKTAIGWGIAEMVDGKVEFVEKDDYDDEDEMAKGGKVKSKKWIQDALSGGKNKGALRRTAAKKGLLRGDENLSKTDLKKLQKMGGTTAKRAHLAETLRKFDEGGDV